VLRKSGKSHETAEKTIDIQESDQPDVAKECQKGGNNCKNVIETEIRQHKIPFNKLMSRSIQTSMQCLDIDKDQHESKAECKNENIISVVPLIVEHTINEDSTRQNRKSITSSEQFLDERSISPVSFVVFAVISTGIISSTIFRSGNGDCFGVLNSSLSEEL
jgi:hypothetical protein